MILTIQIMVWLCLGYFKLFLSIEGGLREARYVTQGLLEWVR